jgi:hypothetical protein
MKSAQRHKGLACSMHQDSRIAPDLHIVVTGVLSRLQSELGHGWPNCLRLRHGSQAVDFGRGCNAEFPSEVIEIMTTALQAAVATLPEPVHSVHVRNPPSTLRTTNFGERDAAVLERIALIELRLTQRR